LPLSAQKALVIECAERLLSEQIDTSQFGINRTVYLYAIGKDVYLLPTEAADMLTLPEKWPWSLSPKLTIQHMDREITSSKFFRELLAIRLDDLSIDRDINISTINTLVDECLLKLNQLEELILSTHPLRGRVVTSMVARKEFSLIKREFQTRHFKNYALCDLYFQGLDELTIISNTATSPTLIAIYDSFWDIVRRVKKGQWTDAEEQTRIGMFWPGARE
jgi:hypothetical protein